MSISHPTPFARRKAPPTKPVHVYLARHGETEWNLQARFQGHQDSPLTSTGLEQARLLAAELAAVPLKAVFSSDLGRALTTAKMVAERHGLEVTSHSGLREVDMGHWTGLDRDQVAERWPNEREAFRLSPGTVCFPGGETLALAQRRALDALAEMLRPYAGGRVAIITHGTVLETLMASAFGFDLSALWLRLAHHCRPHHLAYADGHLAVLKLAGGENRSIHPIEPGNEARR
jgi:broad specificity phosphatase PhoE